MTDTPNRPPLSPATRAILQAFDARYELCGPFDDNWQELCLAAALRAATDQVVPPCSTRSDRGTQRMMIRHELLAIAAELEGRQAEPPRSHVFPTPHQIAECGGLCEQGGPEACDCGLYERSTTKTTH